MAEGGFENPAFDPDESRWDEKRNAYKMEKIEKEVQALSQLIEQSQTKLDAIQEEHGSDVEMEEENRNQKQLIKNYKTDLESQMKEIAAAKNLGKKSMKGTR